MMIKTVYTSIFLFLVCASSWSAELQINTQTCKNGENVTFTVFIHNAPDPVNAFGFEIAYDPTCMIYKSAQRGALISNGFQFFQASNVGFGRIRVGGIETGDKIIPKQAIGSLALIQFSVIGEKNSSVLLENLKDDLKTWTTQHGQLILQTEETDDVNNSENDGTDSESDIADSENDSSNNVISNSSSDGEQSANIQTTLNTATHSHSNYMATNDDTQTTSTNNTNNSYLVKSSHLQQTAHEDSSKKFQQLKGKEHQKIDQQVDPEQKNHPNNKSNQKMQGLKSDNHNPQRKVEQQVSRNVATKQDSLKNVSTETLTNSDWGHIKSVGFSSAGADTRQNVAIPQNHIFTFPSFLTRVIVISMIVQMGILIMLILIYSQLLKNKRR